MKYGLFLILVTLAPEVSAGARDCILDPKELPPLLPSKDPAFRGRVQTKRGKHGLTERVRLKAGGALKIVQGGCAHYGATYEFSGLTDAHALGDRAYYLERAAALLAALPPRETEAPGAEFARHARAAIKDVGKANLPDAQNVVSMWGDCDDKLCESSYACGDATCTVKVKRQGKKLLVTAVYDFAL